MKRIKPPDIIAGALDIYDGKPYICDCRSLDIPNTIRWMIRNAPEGMVAISLRPYGADMIKLAEREARRRNARIIWVPIGTAIKDQAAALLEPPP
jgi:orotidine-5'-phosphate decarboxylase